MSNFNTAVSQTPRSTRNKRIIPWDSSMGDFVYGAIQDACFKRRYNRKSLKMKIDREMDPDDWDPVSGYNTCFLVTLILIFLALVITGVLIAVFFENFQDFWYWWLLGFVVLLVIFIVVLCIVRSSSNGKASRRNGQLEEVCDYINNKYLTGVGTGIFPGQAGAWLEVDLDPRKTRIEGEIEKDKGEEVNEKKVKEKKSPTSEKSEKYRDDEANESFQALNGKESSRMSKSSRKDRKVKGGISDFDDDADEVSSKKSVRFEDESSPGKSKYDSIKSKKSSGSSRSRKSSLKSKSAYDSAPKSERKVTLKDKVTEKNTTFVEINYSQKTPKKKGFYERFKKFRESGKSSGDGGIRVEYESEIPQQRVINDFVPTMNLMKSVKSDKSEFDDY